METLFHPNNRTYNFPTDITLSEYHKEEYLLYTRRSTDDADNQKNSIEYQLAEGLKFIEREKIQLAHISIDLFCEEGIIKEYHSSFKESKEFEVLSGGRVVQKIERPKFLFMAYLLKKKYFKGIVCLCWDRISRNRSDDTIISKLIRLGIDVRFVDTTYDNSAAGELHMEVDAAFSRHYSRTISEKVRRTAKHLRAEGRCIYQSPIGYLDKGSDQKIIDPSRASVVKRIFELYATGEWSYSKLAVWANKQGLTTKPSRRKRTATERLMGIPLESLPKVSRAVTPKSIEHILENPFYIGKNVHENQWIDSTAHQAIIDEGLFYKVMQMRKQRTTSVQYPEIEFATYRGLVQCGDCARTFSPYVHKGKTYYRLKCKSGCTNTLRNISETILNDSVYQLFSTIYFSEEELEAIGKDAEQQLQKVTEKRDKELEDQYRKLNKAIADADYLSKEKLTLLRTGAMTLETLSMEEARLKAEITEIQVRIDANAESTMAMLEYIITFSNLLKGGAKYFKYALDTEKREIVTQVFSNLTIFNGKLEYVANEGYMQLMEAKAASFTQFGAPDYLFSNLREVYTSIKKVSPSLKQLLRSN